MKSIFLNLILLLSISSFSQNVDEIISKHVEVMGGNKLDSLKTVIMEGNMKVDQFIFPMKRFISHNTGQRFDVTFSMNKGFTIVTKEKGWNYFPFIGMKNPEPMVAEELDGYLPSLDLQGELYQYKLKGHRVTFAGMDSVDGNACYKLDVTLASGKKITDFVDASTFYIIKTISTGYINGKPALLENRFGNFKQIDGYVFPFVLNVGPAKAFVTKVEVNTPIENSMYEVK